MNYKKYLNDGGKALYRTMDVGRADKAHKVLCGCGLWAFPQIMVDVRNLNPILTGGEKFVCDGCVSSWERQKRAIDPGDIFLIRHEFSAKFAAKMLGKPDVQAEEVKQEYLKKERKKIALTQKAYTTAPEDHPNKLKLEAMKTALDKRIRG